MIKHENYVFNPASILSPLCVGLVYSIQKLHGLRSCSGYAALCYQPKLGEYKNGFCNLLKFNAFLIEWAGSYSRGPFSFSWNCHWPSEGWFWVLKVLLGNVLWSTEGCSKDGELGEITAPCWNSWASSLVMQEEEYHFVQSSLLAEALLFCRAFNISCWECCWTKRKTETLSFSCYGWKDPTHYAFNLDYIYHIKTNIFVSNFYSY